MRHKRLLAIGGSLLFALAGCSTGTPATVAPATPAPTAAPPATATAAPATAAATATPAATAEGWTPVYEGGVLQPLPDGFPTQPITLLNVDEPSSADGLYARAMQNAARSISPVPIEVVDRPSSAFGTWEGLDFVKNQTGGLEGHYPVIASMTGSALDFLTEPITPELGIEFPADVNPVIATELVPFVVISRANAPWSTWLGLVDYAKENPGELRYISLGVGSQLDLAMESIMKQAGIEANKIPLEDPVEIGTVVAAGEGDFAMNVPDVAIGQAQAGRINVLLSVGDQVPEQWPDAATTAELGMNEPWGSLRGFLVPPETDSLHRDWLYELFSKASDAPEYQDRVNSLPGAQFELLDHDGVLAAQQRIIELADPIVRDLGLHYTQQQ